MRRLSIGLIFGALLLAAAPLRAQQGTSSVAGKVTDEQGAILPGASIVVTNEDTGVFREVTSSGEGTYFVSALPPGRYKIVAKLAGFRTLRARRPGARGRHHADHQPDAGGRRPRGNRHGHRPVAARRHDAAPESAATSAPPS